QGPGLGPAQTAPGLDEGGQVVARELDDQRPVDARLDLAVAEPFATLLANALCARDRRLDTGLVLTQGAYQPLKGIQDRISSHVCYVIRRCGGHVPHIGAD